MRSGTDPILGLIGLATKAGKTACGQAACEEAVKGGKAKLVLVASDASENTREPILTLCRLRGVPARDYATKEQLGAYTGKALRAAAAVTDAGLADQIRMRIDNRNENKASK